MWLESGAPYAGSYAGLRNAEEQKRQGYAHSVFWSPVLNQDCRGCHALNKQAPPLPVHLPEEERRALVKVCDYREVDTLITSSAPPPSIREQLDGAGVEVVVV